VNETIHIHACATGCTKHGLDGKPVRALIRRQPEVAAHLLPRSTVGHDVMTFVGLERFVRYRQRDEIVEALERTSGLRLSTGEVSDLERRFLVYLRALHEARSGDLRKVLEKDGGKPPARAVPTATGWPLHIDCTGEDGQGTLLCLCAYAGWRGWALGAWKIPTERADAILRRLRAVVARFGAPCAVMRDLGKAVMESARDLVAGFTCNVSVLSCHLHFLKDIGKDLVDPACGELRELFRRFAVPSRLGALTRDLGRSLGPDVEQCRRNVADWLAGEDGASPLPDGKTGLAVVRAIGQWVLDYPQDGTDAGFPFDRPLLDLYRRCLRALRASESLLRKPNNNARAHAALERLHRILEPVRSELPFQRPARTLERRARLHDELRAALRLRPKSPASIAAPANAKTQRLELRNVEQTVAAFTGEFAKRRPERGPAQDERQAIDLVLAHLERHGPSLWAPVIDLPRKLGGGVRLVERTNVLLEGFWHEINTASVAAPAARTSPTTSSTFRPKPSSPGTSPTPTTSPSSAAASTTSPAPSPTSMPPSAPGRCPPASGPPHHERATAARSSAARSPRSIASSSAPTP
jgi:hypothetical protein